MEKKTYIVTGCAGFIGYCLAKKLLKEGHIIIGIDNFDTPESSEKNDVYYAEHWVKLRKFKNFIPIIEDINNIEEYDILEKLEIEDESFPENVSIDGIFHFAALARIQRAIDQPELASQSNIMGTLRLLELCRELNIPRFVFSSSSNVYGEQEGEHTEEKPFNAQNPYAIHKMTGEYFCKFYHQQYGIKTVMLRYFNVTGPEQNPTGEYALLVPKFCLNAISGKELPIYGDGSKTRAFVHVDDVVNANILGMETLDINCFGEAFNICGEQSYSVNEITQKILDITKSKSEVKHYPDKPGETWLVKTSSKKAEELLQWKRTKNIDETLKDCIVFFWDKYI